MGDIWQSARQIAGNAIDWLGTAINAPVLAGSGSDSNSGLSEKVAGGNTTFTGSNPYNRADIAMLSSNPGATLTENGYSTTIGTPRTVTPTTTTKKDTGGGTGGSGGTGTGTGTGTGGNIDDAKRAQEDAAARQAEANRQAALNRWRGQANAANVAKQNAKGQYDWLIDTIGSNKKDLLDQVATQETEGLQNYDIQQTKTKESYDTARQEILNTYRDLNVEQEKIMRGSGQGQSSRSQEATLRLNNLMGKDLTGVSKSEADSMALIGNAVTNFKNKIGDTKTSIERDAKNKLDSAAVEYSALVNNIDADMYMNDQEKESAYAQAEADLAKNKAAIETWAAQQTLEAQKLGAQMKGSLDNFIVEMTDSNGLLNADLNTKKEAANKVLEAAGYTKLNTETDLAAVTVGNKTKATTKAELDALLASGQITQAQYDQQLASTTQASATPLASSLTSSPVSGASAAISTPQSRVNQDPLLRAIFQA